MEEGQARNYTTVGKAVNSREGVTKALFINLSFMEFLILLKYLLDFLITFIFDTCYCS